MKRMFFSLLVFSLLFSITSIGQNRIILINGAVLNSSSVVVGNESVKLNIEGENQSVTKDEILCIIPGRKAGYTFNQRKHKKLKISKKDIYYNFEGADIARILAYKYYKSPFTIDQLYFLNPNHGLSEEDFKTIFNEQQKKIETRGIVSTVVSGGVFVICLSLFLNALKDANSLLYNNIEMIAPDSPNLEIQNILHSTEYNFALKNCI